MDWGGSGRKTPLSNLIQHPRSFLGAVTAAKKNHILTLSSDRFCKLEHPPLPPDMNTFHKNEVHFYVYMSLGA